MRALKVDSKGLQYHFCLKIDNAAMCKHDSNVCKKKRVALRGNPATTINPHRLCRVPSFLKGNRKQTLTFISPTVMLFRLWT